MDVHYVQEVEARNSLPRDNLEKRKGKDNENPQGSVKLKLDCLLTTFFAFVQH